MHEKPRISVIVTCYNLGRFLDEAIDSVLEQTFQDFEILIVDDGSTDPATVELLRAFDRPKCSVIRIENRGLPGARNEGIRRTTGEYVCCLDADDRLDPTYMAKSCAVLDADPSIAFVSHWLRNFGEEEGDWTPSSADFPHLLDMNTVNGAALVRRDALHSVGLFDESMRSGCEDWDLWIGMVARGLRGVILPEVLFHYRRRADSMSREMMEGDTHVGLYRYMANKHRAAFEEYLSPLLARRERDEVAVLAETHDLALDCDVVLAPENDRLRQEIRTARRKLDRLNRQRETAAELARQTIVAEQFAAEAAQSTRLAETREFELRAANARIVDLENHAQAGRQSIDNLRADVEQGRLNAEALQYQIDRLRRTWSWRITGPLRAIYSVVEKRKGG